MDYQVQALILKTYRLGEADKILHLYSREHGRIEAVAKAAYKLGSSFSAKTQTLNYCDFLLASGRNLDIVREIKMINCFPRINTNYEALTLACFMLDITDQISVGDDHHASFTVVLEALSMIEELASGEDFDLLIFIVAKYLWDLILVLGYKPDLDACSITHKSRPINSTPQYYDYENGSITSLEGYKDFMETNPYEINSIRKMVPGVFKILQIFELNNIYRGSSDLLSLKKLFQSLAVIDNLSLSLKETLNFLHKHLEFRLHKEFKSWKLVEAL